MADLIQTSANVRTQATTQRLQQTAGETITAGMPVYRKAADNKWWKAIDTSVATALAGGIALTNAGADELIDVALSGSINVGATLVLAQIYVVSASGAIAPVGDLLSGDFVTILGVATSTSLLELNINASGVAKP